MRANSVDVAVLQAESHDRNVRDRLGRRKQHLPAAIKHIKLTGSNAKSPAHLILQSLPHGLLWQRLPRVRTSLRTVDPHAQRHRCGPWVTRTWAARGPAFETNVVNASFEQCVATCSGDTVKQRVATCSRDAVSHKPSWIASD